MERNKLPVKYNPAWCEHKLPNGLSAWQFQSEEQCNVNGGPNKVTIHVCLHCGSINIGGYRTSKDGKSTNRFNETFHIYFQDAIDAIIKQANFYNEEVIWGRIGRNQDYAELKDKYDNILATEDGHESQTENVWQSGYAAGHDAGYERRAKDHAALRARCERMEKALNWYADDGNYLGDNGELSTAYKSKMPNKAREALKQESEKKDPDWLIWLTDDSANVPDLTELNDSEKQILVETLFQSCGRQFLKLFYALDLKTHMESGIINVPTNDLFRLRFELMQKGGTDMGATLQEIPSDMQAVEYPKLTPEQIQERKEAIEWIRNPGGGMRWVKASKGLPLHRAFWNMPGKHNNNECYFPVRIDGFKYRVGEIYDNRQEGAPDPIYYFVIDGKDWFEKDFHRIEWLDEGKEVDNA